MTGAEKNRTLTGAIPLTLTAREVEKLQRIADQLNVMGHPTRLLIIGTLKCIHEAAVTQIAELLQIPVASVSQHLKTMERLGLLRHRRVGRKNYYSVRSQMATDICDLLCRQLDRETSPRIESSETFVKLRNHLIGLSR